MKTYQIVSSQISDIRLLLNRGGLSIPKDKNILSAFEQLSVFVIKNFELPESHEKYIYENLKIEKYITNISDELVKQNSLIKEHFDIELKLRAIEAYFLWGKPENIEHKKLITLKYLIAKLHSLVGDKMIVFNSLKNILNN